MQNAIILNIAPTLNRPQ